MALLGKKPSRGINVLKLSARNYASLAAVSSILLCVTLLSCLLYLVVNQLFSLGLCVRVLSDQEEKAVVNQKV